MLKTIILNLFLIVFFNQKVQSQTEYMPLGAKLYGDTYTPFTGIGNFTTTSEKDTLCGGIPCRKIVTIEKSFSPPKTYSFTYFTRQIKGSIFFWDSYSQKFDLGFRTNMSVGDSIHYKYYRFCCGDSAEATLFADSVKYINSMQITKCHINCPSYISGGNSNRIEFLIHDRFGTAYNLKPIFFCDFGFYDGTRYLPICYQDNQIFFPTTNFNGSNCGLATLTTEIDNSTISISPNPTDNYLDISSNENTLIRTCSLVDALGHIIQENTFEDVKTAHAVLNNVANGVYLLKIKTDLGHLVVKKIIVNH